VTQQDRRFSVPEPPARPGETPDFSYLQIEPAREKPPPDIEAREIRPLAYQLIRVLDDSGRAVGPWIPETDPDALITGLTDMVRTRAFDAAAFSAQRQGKTSFYAMCTGEEAFAVGHAHELGADDMFFPTYRNQGWLIARRWPMVDMFNQIFSNPQDRLGGRQLPALYSAREVGFFTVSGNLATQYPQAVGWAIANDIKGDSGIASVVVGEGSTAENDFHTGLTFAATYHAPVILNVVNNQWAISTFQGVAKGSSPTFAAKALGVGIAGIRVDANDYLAVIAATRWARERAREGNGPALIEWLTYRVGAHSSADDPSKYRSALEAEGWPLGDPIKRLKEHLILMDLWTEDQHAQLVTDAEAEVRQARLEAESHGTLLDDRRPSPAKMFEDVFEVVPDRLRRQRQELGY
jgi:2-oxoisovalerate dehydrogenase E1 component alpha subunit